MKIQPVQNNIQKPAANTQFKAAYPVVHWVAETNGSYAPALTMELTKKLQRVLITLLNKSDKNTSSKASGAVDYLSKCDMDFRKKKSARSFYDNNGGWDSTFKPLVYMITGNDVSDFNAAYGKSIGKSKSQAPIINGRYVSAEVNEANRNYAIHGRKFIMDKNKRIYDSAGIEYILHTKFQTIRNKNGKIKGYEFIDLRFCPSKGPDNPFVRTGLVGQQ